MPTNLLLILGIQAVTCGVVHVIARNSRVGTLHHWLSATWFGFTLGILMDIILGDHGIFAYLPAGEQTPVRPIELPVATLCFNAVASYGIAVATISVLAEHVTAVKEHPRFVMRATALVTTVGVAAIIVVSTGTLGMMFAWAVVIISCGELFLLTHRLTGPFVALVAGNSMAPLAKLWAFSAAIGIVYELGNWFFPFWVWLPNSYRSPLANSALVAILGYVVLIHPIVVFWALIHRRR